MALAGDDRLTVADDCLRVGDDDPVVGDDRPWWVTTARGG